jgi:hypothetical protein
MQPLSAVAEEVAGRVAYAVTVPAFFLQQYVLALAVGVPALVSLMALVRVRQRQGRSVLEEALRKRQDES